jgi:hypothetical protein
MLSDLTTSVAVALELGISPSDLRVPRLIAVASAAIKAYLDRGDLHYGERTEKIKGYGTRLIVVKCAPIDTITAIVIDGQTLDAPTYEVEESSTGIIARIGGVWPFTGFDRASVAGGVVAGTESPSIRVTYKCGWVTPNQASSAGWAGPARSLPFEIEEACVQTVVALYRRGGEDREVQSERLGDYSATYLAPGIGGLLSNHALAALAPHRRLPS